MGNYDYISPMAREMYENGILAYSDVSDPSLFLVSQDALRDEFSNRSDDEKHGLITQLVLWLDQLKSKSDFSTTVLFSELNILREDMFDSDLWVFDHHSVFGTHNTLRFYIVLPGFDRFFRWYVCFATELTEGSEYDPSILPCGDKKWAEYKSNDLIGFIGRLVAELPALQCTA